MVEAKGPFSGAYRGFGSGYQNPYGASRFDSGGSGGGGPQFKSSYQTPGWQRAQSQHQHAQAQPQYKKWPDKKGARKPLQIEGELVASSTAASDYKTGERVFHEKFGYGTISEVDGNKLTVEFEKAGSKRVVDSFVTRA